MEERKRLTVKDWNADDRPREKMLKHGVQHLTDVELLAILLRSGSADQTVVEVAQNLLRLADHNLNTLARLSIAQLTKLKGVGPTKAVTVQAALELGRRLTVADLPEQPRITCSKDICTIMKPHLADLLHEEFWVLLLNNANCLLRKQRVGQGGLSVTPVDLRLIMKMAIDQSATSIAVVHNHPSGDVQPSAHDRELTEKIRQAAQMLDIKLLDHVIIGHHRHYSFADESWR